MAEKDNFDSYFFNSDSFINYTDMGGSFFSSNSDNSFKFIKREEPKDIEPIEGVYSNYGSEDETPIFSSNMETKEKPPETQKMSLKEYILKYTKNNSFRIFTVSHFKEDGSIELFNGLSYELATKKMIELGNKASLSVFLEL